MAKTGTFTIAQEGNGPAELAAVVQSEPYSGTLGAVVLSALKAAPNRVRVVVNTQNRKVSIIRSNVPTGVLSEGLDGVNLHVVKFTRDSEAIAGTSSITAEAGGHAGTMNVLADLTEPTKPTFSLQTLISNIEDLLGEAGLEAVLLIDQEDGAVSVYSGNTNQVEPMTETLENLATEYSGGSVLATYTQNVTQATVKDAWE